MPKRTDHLLILDIISSVEKILEYTKGMTLDDFQTDKKTIDAVVRNFEIIGEAGSRISKEFQNSHSAIPWAGMIGLRNKIVHDYFGIDSKIIWKIISEFIPDLRREVEKVNLQPPIS